MFSRARPIVPANFLPPNCSRQLSPAKFFPSRPIKPQHRFVVAHCVLSKMNPPHLFHEYMAPALLKSAREVMSDSKIATFEEFISSDALLTKVGKEFQLYSYGDPLRKMPARSPGEIRYELIRLNSKWKKLIWKDEEEKTYLLENAHLWAEESEDDDDIFMPSSKGKRAASSKGKSAAPSKGKSASSAKCKSKGK